MASPKKFIAEREQKQSQNDSTEIEIKIDAGIAPIAFTLAQAAIEEGSNVALAQGLAIDREKSEITFGTKDRLDGLKAFEGKREPVFTGKWLDEENAATHQFLSPGFEVMVLLSLAKWLMAGGRGVGSMALVTGVALGVIQQLKQNIKNEWDYRVWSWQPRDLLEQQLKEKGIEKPEHLLAFSKRIAYGIVHASNPVAIANLTEISRIHIAQKISKLTLKLILQLNIPPEAYWQISLLIQEVGYRRAVNLSQNYNEDFKHFVPNFHCHLLGAGGIDYAYDTKITRVKFIK